MQETVSINLEMLEASIESRDGSALLKAVESLHYADIADFQETLTEYEDLEFLVKTLGPIGFYCFNTSEKRELFAQLSDDDLTDVLRALDEVKRSEMLGILGRKDKELVRTLLRYDEDTAGGWMTTQIGRVTSEMSVKTALASLRVNLESTDTLSRIFVVEYSHS